MNWVQISECLEVGEPWSLYVFQILGTVFFQNLGTLPEFVYIGVPNSGMLPNLGTSLF